MLDGNRVVSLANLKYAKPGRAFNASRAVVFDKGTDLYYFNNKDDDSTVISLSINFSEFCEKLGDLLIK